MRMIAVDPQFVDDAIGRGGGMERLEVAILVDRHGGGSLDGGRANRGLRGEKTTEAERRRAGRRLFCFATQRRAAGVPA